VGRGREPGEVVIEARGLTKRFGSTLAVDHLSFTVRPGLVTGLLGPNGAGKSTTMRLILGLNRPTRGQALINGMPYVRVTRGRAGARHSHVHFFDWQASGAVCDIVELDVTEGEDTAWGN
jgi:ABC-type multidrug transport system ATPase subunit